MQNYYKYKDWGKRVKSTCPSLVRRTELPFFLTRSYEVRSFQKLWKYSWQDRENTEEIKKKLK